MIGASFLLLVGLSDPSATEGDLLMQVAAPARPNLVPTAVPQLPKKDRRPRVVRRSPRNDITETLRAMNLMEIGADPRATQRNSPNN